MSVRCNTTVLFGLVLFLLSASWKNVCAQQNYDYNNLHFRQYNILQGIPSDACTKIYKDSYGFVWVSTYYGVSIFNGSQFINLPIFSFQKNYYLGDFPYTFLQVNKDSMLISCSDGLYVFNYNNKNINKLTANGWVPMRTRVSILGFNENKTKLFVKVGSLIYVFDNALHEIDSVKCTNENARSSITNEYTSPFCFYYTSSGHIAELNLETFKIDSILYLPDQSGEMIVNCQSPKRYVIATTEGVYTVNKSDKNDLTKNPFPEEKSDLPFQPLCIKMDYAGNYWIGGRAKLYIFSPSTNSLSVANTVFTDSIANKIIIVDDVLIDKDGLYLSTINNGLLKYDNRYSNFEDYYLPTSMNSSVYSMVLQGDKLLCCSNTGGMMVYMPYEQTSKRIENVSFGYGDIVQIEKLDSKNVWLIFRENFKLAIVNTENYQLADTTFPIDKLAESRFKSIGLKFPRIDLQPTIKKAAANLYYYSLKNYLYRIKGNIQSGLEFSLVDSLSSLENISALTVAPSGEIILGTSNFEMFVLEQNKLLKKTQPQISMRLPVKSISVDASGNIYAITINGLYIFDPDFNLTKHLDERDTKLVNNILYAGTIDKKGILWASANEGIISYDTRSGRVNNFSSSKLFHGREFNSKSIYEDSAGNIYFGGTNGVTVVHTNKFSSAVSDNRLYFSEIKNIDSAILHGIMPGSFSAEKPFAYNKNTFSFSISTVSHKQIEETNYRYKLDGFDTAWSAPNNNKEISYINLPPGDYTFRAKEAYSSSDQDHEISYSFHIARPYWKTAWFIILMIVSGASLLGFIIKYIMDKRLEKQRIKVSRELALRSERERISQELHDDLGSGLTSIRLLSKTVISKQQNGAGISNMLDSIGKISGELIDQMGEIVWLMNHMDDTINGLLAHLRIYMADYLQRTGMPLRLRFENTIKEDYEITSVQRRNILLVVKEAFHNVVKHSKATDFSVNCYSSEKWIHVTISDNGIGLPKEMLANGNGISNIKKRVAAVNGNVQFESVQGTKIIIALPKEKQKDI